MILKEKVQLYLKYQTNLEECSDTIFKYEYGGEVNQITKWKDVKWNKLVDEFSKYSDLYFQIIEELKKDIPLNSKIDITIDRKNYKIVREIYFGPLSQYPGEDFVHVDGIK